MKVTRFRPESCCAFLLLLSFCLCPVPLHAGTTPLHPVWDAHEDHGDEGGGSGDPVVAPPAQGPTSCVNGFADVYPCRNVDLLSFLPLPEMGAVNARGSDIWGWTDPQTGREYALMVMSNGASFVDVSDPARPRWLGYLPTESGQTSSNRDVRVYRDHAYVVADAVGAHGMQVFDLRRLRNVATPQTFRADKVYRAVDTVHNIDIDVDTGFAYLVGANVCDGGLHMVDLRDPINPRFAGCYSAVGYIHDVQCVIYRGPDQRFAGHELCFASNVRHFTILDVTDKANVRQLARKTYAGVGYCHQGALTEDHRYFLMDDEADERANHHNTRTYLWDISDPTDPNNFANYDHATRAIDHDQYVRGGFVYQANYRAGLRILDLAKIGQGTLEEAGYFDIVPEDDDPSFGGAWGAYPYFKSGVILVPGMEQGLYVLRRSDTVKPGPCKAGAQTLCLAAKRFRVEVDWTNPSDGTSGRGKAVRGSGAAGYFSFSSPSNLELIVKILDDGSHWRLYYGQLTNLPFTIRVTDTKTGRVGTYGNGPNNCGGAAELAPSDGHEHSEAPVWLGADPLGIPGMLEPGEGISESFSLSPEGLFEDARRKGTCTKTADSLCLLGRYRVRVTWRNPFNGAAGKGKGQALSSVAGSFSFTNRNNPELAVKAVADGSRTLVIWGATTNLEYTLEVTDTKTGKVETHHNPAGTYCGGMEEF